MNAQDLRMISYQYDACKEGDDWLRKFDYSASCEQVLDALRLSDVRYLRWLLHDAHDPIFLPDYLVRLRTALTEYLNLTVNSRTRMMFECKNILDASPVNLDTWSRRVERYDDENRESWSAFKQSILPDLMIWLERLRYGNIR